MAGDGAKRKRGEEEEDEMDLVAKRRQRMLAWQEQRKKKRLESEGGVVVGDHTQPNAPPSTLQWRLDDDDDDDDDDDVDDKGKDGEANATRSGDSDDDGVDPLDAFMAAEVLPEVDRLRREEEEKQKEVVEVETRGSGGAGGASGSSDAKAASAPSKPKKTRRYASYYDSSDDSGLEEGEEESASEDDEEWAKRVVSGKGSKLEKLVVVDHSKIDYEPFRKNFFIESPEIAKLTEAEVAKLRKDLGNVKVRGKDVPRPIKGWHQCGLSSRVLQTIAALGFETPMPIQAQALPITMQGRDCIGIAKTGSGKTMAFVLPMIRHIKDQPALRPGDGPVALVMAPTRELVQQIGKDVKRFAKSAGIRLVCVYGGSGVSDQISALKRGAEVVVCTPGRMIDVLAMGSGNRITNLRRVTYVVLDEADRMFDMGFEPQIKRMLGMVRPDRQTVMFSATFPRQVESLARLALTDPVEVLCGGRSVVNQDIDQIVEIRPEDQRFLRLLELLGVWYERGKVLVFVSSQDRCDNLFRDLLRSGYPCMSLHGGKDQSDRESTIADFKGDVCGLLVATSVAARGLDVKELKLVVNYDCPNHHEDYVHRVGRTGRAGNKGTAVTFIAPDEEKFAPDLVKALEESGRTVPVALREMAEDFGAKLGKGLTQAHGSGFGGSGFKFDEEEEETKKRARRAVQRQFGGGANDSDGEGGEGGGDEDEDDDIKVTTKTGAELPKPPQEREKEKPAPPEAAQGPQGQRQGVGRRDAAPQSEAPGREALLAAARAVARQIEAEAGYQGGAATSSALPTTRPALGAPSFSGAAPEAHYSTEIEINDFPQKARWQVTQRETMFRLQEEHDVAITNKGVYVAPGRQAPAGERKLYLLVEGPTERGVKQCKAEMKRIIKEATERAMVSGRYQI